MGEKNLAAANKYARRAFLDEVRESAHSILEIRDGYRWYFSSDELAGLEFSIFEKLPFEYGGRYTSNFRNGKFVIDEDEFEKLKSVLAAIGESHDAIQQECKPIISSFVRADKRIGF